MLSFAIAAVHALLEAFVSIRFITVVCGGRKRVQYQRERLDGQYDNQ